MNITNRIAEVTKIVTNVTRSNSIEGLETRQTTEAIEHPTNTIATVNSNIITRKAIKGLYIS